MRQSNLIALFEYQCVGAFCFVLFFEGWVGGVALYWL